MTISNTVKQYMKRQGIQYEIVRHPRTVSSLETAHEAHVAGDCMAKAVMLEDEQGYLVAVLPATHRVELGDLHRALHRNLGLATEREINDVFWDCAAGAIPPTGAAYGVETVIDDSLDGMSEVYFEGGDHEELIHVSADQFRRLMGKASHAHFSRPM